jgi:hypothetical protein
VNAFTKCVHFAIASLVSLPALALDCKDSDFTNATLQNNQEIRISGGDCGGTYEISVVFAGKAQFFNKGDDPVKKGFASLSVRGDNGEECYKQDPQGKDGTGFNTFSLPCTLKGKVAQGITRKYLIKYGTKNVSDQPIPTLQVNVSYKAD